MKNFKKVLLMAASLVLTAAIAIGATVAYLQWDDSEVNVMTLGNVKIEQIEQERNDKDELVDFTQAKPAFPAVGKEAWAEKNLELNGGEYKMFDAEAVKNVIDKIVTVKNTGKSDAFVRTIIALEAPDGDPKDLIHVNVNGDVPHTSWTRVKINGIDYVYSVFTYKDALAPKTSSAPSLLQVFLDSETTNDDCAKFGDTWEILVLSQAVQTAGFDKAETALNTGFGEANATNVAEWFGGKLKSSTVSTDAQLKEAITADKETIVVSLDKDVSLDVSAWSDNQWSMGGAPTKNIMILGNGNTLTFNQKNSDWNNVDTNNDAKLTIIDAKISNSGYNNGPWNRHDINFACDVELINVVSDKALAFKAGATLKNVTINDANTSDTYAIWIQPNGQTVDIDGLTVDMIACTDGRGIKIDEQYVSAPEKVTLNVKNATFKTEEKAAILVKSAAGANITLENIDITGVKADPINAVWVDADAAAYADLVTVTGGNKILEGKQADPSTIVIIKTADELFAFAKDVNVNKKNYSGKTVILADDIDLENKPWTPIGQTGATEFRGTFDGQNHTIKNLSIDNSAYTDEHTSTGLFGWAESGVTIKNVKVDGATVKGNHNVAVIVGYTYSGKITNCHVSNATVTCNHKNDNACGDKAGTIAGYTADEARLSNCTASNSTVTAGRDAGQLFGLAYNKSISDCSATQVTVSATGECTGNNIRNEVIGRVMG